MCVADSRWKNCRRSCECGEDLQSERTPAWVACLVPPVPLKDGSLYGMEAPHASTVLFCFSASLGVRAGLCLSHICLSIVKASRTRTSWQHYLPLLQLGVSQPRCCSALSEALQTWVCISAVPLPRVTAAHSGLVLASLCPL